MTYTHGHHESVLRSHTWRTAENSAAYLLPHLRPGQDLLDVGCGPGTITADLALLVAPGQVVGLDAAGDVVARAQTARRPAGAGQPALRGGRPLRPRLPRRRRSTWSTCTRCSSISPTPPPPWSSCAGCSGPTACSPPVTRTTATFTWAPADPAAGPLVGVLPGGDGAQRPRRAHRAASARRWPTRRGSPTSSPRARRGPTPTPRRGSGGAACGRTGCATRVSPSRRSSMG